VVRTAVGTTGHALKVRPISAKGKRKAGDRDSCAFDAQGPTNWSAGVKDTELAVSFVEKDAPDLEGGDKVKLTR
jgi:hypothetical protein